MVIFVFQVRKHRYHIGVSRPVGSVQCIQICSSSRCLNRNLTFIYSIPKQPRFFLLFLLFLSPSLLQVPMSYMFVPSCASFPVFSANFSRGVLPHQSRNSHSQVNTMEQPSPASQCPGVAKPCLVPMVSLQSIFLRDASFSQPSFSVSLPFRNGIILLYCFFFFFDYLSKVSFHHGGVIIITQYRHNIRFAPP